MTFIISELANAGNYIRILEESAIYDLEGKKWPEIDAAKSDMAKRILKVLHATKAPGNGGRCLEDAARRISEFVGNPSLSSEIIFEQDNGELASRIPTGFSAMSSYQIPPDYMEAWLVVRIQKLGGQISKTINTSQLINRASFF